MVKVTLIISALLVGSNGPETVPQKRYEQKDLVTCLESAKSYLVTAEEAILSDTNPVIGAAAFCVLEFQKPEGQSIQGN